MYFWLFNPICITPTTLHQTTIQVVGEVSSQSAQTVVHQQPVGSWVVQQQQPSLIVVSCSSLLTAGTIIAASSGGVQVMNDQRSPEYWGTCWWHTSDTYCGSQSQRALTTGYAQHTNIRQESRSYVSTSARATICVITSRELCDQVCLKRELCDQVCLQRELCDQVCSSRELCDQICLRRKLCDQVCLRRELCDHVCLCCELLTRIYSFIHQDYSIIRTAYRPDCLQLLTWISQGLLQLQAWVSTKWSLINSFFFSQILINISSVFGIKDTLLSFNPSWLHSQTPRPEASRWPWISPPRLVSVYRNFSIFIFDLFLYIHFYIFIIYIKGALDLHLWGIAFPVSIQVVLECVYCSTVDNIIGRAFQVL